jgi:hypothetical protein
MSGDDLGTVAIMAATGKTKTRVWRWQDRFMAEGMDCLLRDKWRPPSIVPCDTELGPEVKAPICVGGYGSNLVERSVSGHLRGPTNYNWSEFGLVVSLVVNAHCLAG